MREPIATAATRGGRSAAALALLVALAGCGEPQGPAFEPSEAALAAPRPTLGPTGALRAARAEATREGARLAQAAAALAARAEGVAAAAAALDRPVIDPARRERLMAAAARAAAQP